MTFSDLDALFYICVALCQVYYMVYLIHATLVTSIPMRTVFLAPLSTSFTFVITIDVVTLLLLLLSHYCCHHITVTTNKLCQANYFHVQMN